MANSHTERVSPDFSIRESARNYEFSGIWNSGVKLVFADVAPYYNFASNLASLGLCKKWRQRFVSTIDVRPGDAVLDVCAGTNGVGIELLQRQPDAHVFAVDRSHEMQEVGRSYAQDRGMHIVSIISDAHHLPFPDNSFDIVTLQWASRHLKIVDVFLEVNRLLKPGGSFYHCDMLKPRRRIIEALYSMYLNICVSTIALLFRCSRQSRSCRDYFVRTMQMFYSADELTQLLINTGFSEVSSRAEVGGIVASHKAIKGSNSKNMAQPCRGSQRR